MPAAVHRTRASRRPLRAEPAPVQLFAAGGPGPGPPLPAAQAALYCRPMEHAATAPRRRSACRARLVLLRDGPRAREVLLALHRRAAESFWCFPGGAVEPGETFAAAACREAREETGLEVRLLGVCYLQDRPEADSVEWFFAARADGGRLRLGSDPERAPGCLPVLADLRWVCLDRLAGMDVRPRDLAEALADGRFFGWGRLPVQR